MIMADYYKKITIGRNPLCDYQLKAENTKTSRNHATLLILKDGRFFIEDYSSNGTTINGSPIHNEQREIYRGDVVSFADQETLDWDRIPVKKERNLKKYILPSILILCLLGVIWYLTCPTCPESCKKLTVNQIYKNNKNSVGLIIHTYLIKTRYGSDGNLFIGYDKEEYQDNQSLEVSFSLNQDDLLPFMLTGTGFLINPADDGFKANIVTNRHVASPGWLINHEIYSTSEQKELYQRIKKVALAAELKYDEKVNFERNFKTYTKTLRYISNKDVLPIKKAMSYQDLLNQLGQSNAVTLRWSSNNKIDIALLKGNMTITNDNSIDLSTEINTNNDSIKVGHRLTILGFSGGIAEGYEFTTGSMEFQTSATTVSQPPDRFNITYEISTSSGSSGSPVFDECGRLIAVHYAHLGTKGLGIPVKQVLNVLNFKSVVSKSSTGTFEYH